jgi:DNA-binding CsgD family transcriptional regulator
VLGSPDTLPFRAATALLDALAAADGSVLITVEDLQWLDEASWDALAFVARRLGSERAAMVLTARDGGDVDRRLTAAGLPETRLEPLGREDSRALLASVAPDLPSALSAQVLEAAQGNPLGLVELGEVAGRAGAVAVPATALPLSERLERTFAGLVAELPPMTRSLLLVAALDDGDDLDEIVRAGPAGARAADLDPAVATRLVQVDDQYRVRFRHPLLRSALYQSASATERRRVHGALAAVVTADPERTVWHRAAAADGPDEELARQLTEFARRAKQRDAAGIAVIAFDRAARLSADIEGRSHRQFAAMDAIGERGDTGETRRRLGEIRRDDLPAGDRALYDLMHEVYFGTRWSGADRLLGFADAVEAVCRDGNVRYALEIIGNFAIRAHFANPEPAVTARLVEAVEQVAAVTDDPQVPAFLALISPVEHGAECLDRIRAAVSAGDMNPYTLHHLGLGASAMGDLPTAVAAYTAAEATLRSLGQLGMLSKTTVSHAACAVHLGDARAARALAEEGASLARETGEQNWVPVAWMVAGAAEALAGDLAAAAAHTDRAEAVLLPAGRTPLLSGVRRARAFIALAAGRPAEAYRELCRILDPADDSFHAHTGHHLVGHLAEAAAGCGETAGLRAVVAELTPIGELSRSPELLLGLGYAGAVLADTAEGYEKLLAEDLAGWPFEQARRRHAYGTWLRRRRRPAESRPLLRAAAATFDALGATAWADRSRAELRASGESLRRPAQAGAGLTPQETQIARLAADGLSNREIADRLFLSHRTVATHLSRIYPKLGIRSRSELGRALGVT